MNDSIQLQYTECASVVMSFDFEMRWGVHDVYGLDIDGYRKNLENSRPVVIETLKLLAERKLRATWATVGALGLDNWKEYFSVAPAPPKYLNQKLAIRKEYADMDPDGLLHFAPDLIRKIVQSPGQELGSHSFSHLYFREPGVKLDDFLDDTNAVEVLFSRKFGIIPKSFVYPRNQSAYDNFFEKTSVKIWRGHEPAWFYDCTSSRSNTLIARGFRLIDSVNPLMKRSSKPEKGMVRASLFVRFGLPERLWRLQLMRIRNELASLFTGDVLHFWWHPHNLGFDLDVGFKRLAQVLDMIAEACVSKSLVSRAMGDLLTPEDVGSFS